MRVCLLSKYGHSSNLLYSGTRMGLEENNIQYTDIDISTERKEKSPHWVSIPTLSPIPPKNEDAGIIKKIVYFKPNLILLLQYAGIPFLIDNGQIIRKLLVKNVSIAFWFVDLAQTINENKELGKYIDFFFLSNEGQLEEYKSKWVLKKSIFMPQGCYTTDAFKIQRKYKYKVVFLGRNQRRDKRYIKRNMLLDAFKKTVGLTEFNKEISIENTLALYQESKIIIGSSWNNDIPLYSSDRIFNVLGGGGFYLCSYFPGIEKLFRNHKHLVWFNTIGEGLKYAEYYLSHDKEREQIAYNGYMLAKEKHTYKKRVKNIIDIVKKKNHQFLGFLKS